jgi:sugar (pentulose or hexulose) kinase
MDHEAGYLSVLGTMRRPLQCSLGTAWVGNFIAREDAQGGSPIQLSIPAPSGPGRLVIQPLLTGNVTWDWALDTFMDTDRARALVLQDAVFSEALLPPEGLVALPWLNRPNPWAAANGATCLVGIGPSADRSDLLRAVAAGMAFELRRVFEAVAARRTIRSVVLSGGASKGRHFRRLIAALFEPVPALLVEGEDWMGSRGCLHAFGSGAAAAEVSAIAPPGPSESAAIRRAYGVYRRIFERFYGDVKAGKPYAVAGGRRPERSGARR